MEKENRYRVKVLEKALHILDCFTIEKPEWSIKELSDHLDLNRTTVFRILSTLNSFDYVTESEETGKYRLGNALFALSFSIKDSIDLKEKARPYLKELLDTTNETITLCVYHNYKSVVVDSYESNQDIIATVPVGRRDDLHAAGTSKALLAYLTDEEINTYMDNGLSSYTDQTITNRDQLWEEIKRIREQKIAYDTRELSIGRAGIASPIFDYNNKVVGSIGIVGPYMRIEKNLEDFSEKVKSTASRISKEMGYIGVY